MIWSKQFSAVFFLLPALLLFTSDVGARNWGRGTVSMQGSIIDAACAISVESRDQTVNMGVSPTGGLREGQETSKPLSIELINCALERPVPNHPGWRNFQVTFDGDADGQLFGISGDAKGIAIQISDEEGHIARPGEALPAGKIAPENMLLKYTIKIVSNNKVIVPGDYFSSIRFKMEYF
ncbi:type 1 fimbrial protein [Enterobacter sp. WCHEn045836]|uniref:fimbrial protein n=1 Tax=Enterobacter sp. WCHEn045836 TaxID=2497434 RepID=UPI000F832F79|nr:fimbrial protein [Enterobacter sp. WCHEn045836]RTP97277.1 type 1 fimbrial protein [Enterobacter sp. WCHEn045836]